MIIEIQNFNEYEKYVSSGDCLIDFYATWCGPCKMLAPILEELSNLPDYESLKILEIDVDKVPEVARKYGIQLIPTLIHIRNGQTIGTTQGYHTLDDLQSFLKK